MCDRAKMFGDSEISSDFTSDIRKKEKKLVIPSAPSECLLAKQNGRTFSGSQSLAHCASSGVC